jgi:hypothetical protein
MSDWPKSRQDAPLYKYGNNNNIPWNCDYCAFEVAGHFTFHQCSRKPGYGPDNLFCRQHAEIIRVKNY